MKLLILPPRQHGRQESWFCPHQLSHLEKALRLTWQHSRASPGGVGEPACPLLLTARCPRAHHGGKDEEELAGLTNPAITQVPKQSYEFFHPIISPSRLEHSTWRGWSCVPKASGSPWHRTTRGYPERACVNSAAETRGLKLDAWTKGFTVWLTHCVKLQLPWRDFSCLFVFFLNFILFYVRKEIARAEGGYEQMRCWVNSRCIM